MPRTKTKPDPSKVYVVWNAFSVDVDGIPQTYPTGYRLRGDHPAVAKWMENFYPDGAPGDEIPDAATVGTKAALEQEATRQGLRDPGGVRVLKPLSGRDVVMVREDMVIGDRMVSRGQRFRKNDPDKKTIADYPEFFVPVIG